MVIFLKTMPLNLIKKIKQQNKLFEYHINCILESKLILDEDFECLLNNYSFNFDVMEKQKLSLFKSIICTATITCALCMGNFYFSIIILSPAICYGFLRVKEVITEYIQKKNIQNFIGNLKNLVKLNKLIVTYLKQRNTMSISISYNRNIKQLLDDIFSNEVPFVKCLLECIKYFSKILPSLNGSYNYLEAIDFTDFNVSNIENIDDCVAKMQKISDIFILVISNFLTALGLVFCPNLCNNSIKIDEIINALIPKVKKKSLDCHGNIRKSFDFVQNLTIKSIKHSKFKSANSKLYNTLFTSMTKGSVILENCQFILEKLEKENITGTTKEIEFGKIINDIRDQAYEYYESLDILCKLYKLSLNVPQEKKFENPPIKEIQKKTNPTIGLDFSNDPKDEEYNLYIGANDVSETHYFHNEDDNESLKFLSLMTQELKQSLKTHKQFLAARQKRGIIDEELVKKEETIDAPPVLVQENEIRNLLPPPPPPLLLQNYNEFNNEIVNGGNLLDSIKAASRNRPIVEEVFQDEINDDNLL